MNKLRQLIRKINKATNGNPIFFITNDAERALGLENLLDHFHIICIDNNYIAQQLQSAEHFFCLEQQGVASNSIFRNSNILLEHPLVQEYIHRNTPQKEASFMFFKIAPQLEHTLEHAAIKAHILNTSSLLNRKFENKVSQYQQLKDTSVCLPPTKVGEFLSISYDEVMSTFGDFVLQFQTGHTGESTIFIDNPQEYMLLQEKFPHRLVKITKRINGNYYTINACVTRKGIAMGGICNQITGVPELTAAKGATCGNDWNQFGLDHTQREQICQQTKRIGEIMAKEGYIGLFGVDFVLDAADNTIKVLEINARSPASIPMYTKIQLQNEQIPLLLLHLLEFLHIEYDIDINHYNMQNQEPIHFAQVIFRNTHPRAMQLTSIPPGGIYEGKTKVGDGYSIDTLTSSQQALFLPSQEGRIISQNAEYTRVQGAFAALQNIPSNNGLINAMMGDMMQQIIQNILQNTSLHNEG